MKLEISDYSLEGRQSVFQTMLLRLTWTIEVKEMEIAVVGPLEFTLGFQLAGVKNLYNPSSDEELSELLKSLLNQSEIGVVVVDNKDLNKLSDRLRLQLTESVTPTVLGIGTEEDNTLRESIKSALGVDLWK